MQTFSRLNSSYIDGSDKYTNLQALCEALCGLAAGEGIGTWANSSILTISDTRVTSTSRILIFGTYGSQDAIGNWRVSARSAGSFTITSTETELAGTTFWYIVVNI